MNNLIDEEMIDRLSDKVLLGLTREENKMILDELEKINKQIEIFSTIPNIESVEPMTHPFETPDLLLREDIAKESINIDEAFSNCDQHEGREIEVPRVVG